MSLSLEKLEQHIIDLQIRFTHQDDTIRVLDEVIQQQQKEIERLKFELEAVKEQIKSQDIGDGFNILSERPPHY